MRSGILASVAVIISTCGSYATETGRFEKGDCVAIRNVDLWDFLYLRARPHHKSEAVGAIAPDTESPIVVSGRCTPNTTNLRRLWCPVTYYSTRENQLNGYVKMYFTRPIECPPSLEYYLNNQRSE